MAVSAETHAKLRQAQDLLRHAIPDGDPALVVNRALSLLLEHLQRARQAKRKSQPDGATRAARRARPSAPPRTPATPRARSRRIPAAVKRAVWERDGGQCAFVGPEGRCVEQGFLEYHHREPFAAGGRTTVENLQLLCRAHNGFEAREYFGEGARTGRITESGTPTRSGPSCRRKG
jgi:5-methylcytosine-specific restriction endonuclease McrA